MSAESLDISLNLGTVCPVNLKQDKIGGLIRPKIWICVDDSCEMASADVVGIVKNLSLTPDIVL
ncbi:fimbria A protein (plasmid) [Leptotrichia wadei]|uniref:Fimbria A protein n=1 Tax=Leptotrichia wadei TaxID=157687 RepID=A0A510KHB8_9FUSO|nr:fimbria A protein [Leptotrichia wadei]